MIAKGETLQMTYRSALAWNKPGDTEFAGHEYRIDFHVDEITGVIVENGKPLSSGNVFPAEDLGQSFHIPSE